MREENKKLEVGDTAYYFRGNLWPEKVKITRIVDRHGSYSTVTVDKKHIVTGKDVVTPDFYLYRTVEEAKQAITRHVSLLMGWLEEH